jgi:hypothetical protein
MKPDLQITLEFSQKFHGSTQVVITGDDTEAWIRIHNEGDDDRTERSVMLDPEEIDVFISALTLFKSRILKPKRREEE